MFKENKAKSTHAEPTKWFDRAPQLTSYHLASDIITKEGIRPAWHPLITCTKDTSSECILLCFLLFSVTGPADIVHFVCLLCFIYLLEGEGAGGGGGMCVLYFVAAVALCVRVMRGAGANLNTTKRIVTLHWNQTNLTYCNNSYDEKK